MAAHHPTLCIEGSMGTGLVGKVYGGVIRRYEGKGPLNINAEAAAREALEQARSTLERLDCPGWAEAAAQELARVSGRRRASEGELTPTERRIAELVATGLSNKEVASELFVTVTTVESHLSKVYAKLGIRSRTQLARHVGASP